MSSLTLSLLPICRLLLPPFVPAVVLPASASHYNWQSVSLGVEPNLGLLTRDLYFFESFCLVIWGRPLWREVGSVICQSVVIIVCSSISMYIQFTFCVTHSSQLNTIKYNRIKNLRCVVHSYNKKNKKIKSYPRNRPWRPVGLWDVKDPTLSRQSAHRWR
jgi:hypothetical protein